MNTFTKLGNKFAPREGFDKLDSMVNYQKTFADTQIPFKSLTQTEKEDWIAYIAGCLMSEGHELKDTTNWKRHKKQKKEFNEAEAIDEAADIIIYALEVMALLNLSSEDIYYAVMRKVEVCHARLAKE